MTVVITNAEPVADYQRRVIAEAFQCPVRETYGMAEMVAAASECQAGSLHLWPELGYLEIFDGNRPVGPGREGSFIGTGLLNDDMLLIRYEVGDRGVMAIERETCACGRRLPMLKSVEGRMDEVLYTADGRRIGRLDPVFKAKLPVREAQIVQETLNRVRVRFVPVSRFDSAAAASITERLRDRMGDIEVILEEVDEIPRTSCGKFRAVISHLPSDVRRELEGASSSRHNIGMERR
jgi:phenylacetate-CoA ligase